MGNKTIGRPVVNRFKVPKKMWSKWSAHAQQTFNAMYISLRPSMQWAFLHPQTTPLPQKEWKVIRWNAAVTAACVANGEGFLARVVTQ